MNSLRFSKRTSSNGVVERDFTVGAVTGALWSPVSGSDGAPLVLMGHGGGLHKKTPAQSSWPDTSSEAVRGRVEVTRPRGGNGSTSGL